MQLGARNHTMPDDPFYKSPLWLHLRRAVRRRSHGICEVPGCGQPAVVCDHIVRRSDGGLDTLDNLRDLCRSHDNQVKEDRHGQRRSGGRLTVKGCDAHGRPLDPGHPWAR